MNFDTELQKTLLNLPYTNDEFDRGMRLGYHAGAMWARELMNIYFGGLEAEIEKKDAYINILVNERNHCETALDNATKMGKVFGLQHRSITK
jgi:hypothetical protein